MTKLHELAARFQVETTHAVEIHGMSYRLDRPDLDIALDLLAKVDADNGDYSLLMHEGGGRWRLNFEDTSTVYNSLEDAIIALAEHGRKG